MYHTKGKNNINWRGGISEYPNHYLMKKNRLIILIQNPKCEVCNKKSATEVHHKDKNKSNHSLSNLMAVCRRCHLGILHKGTRKPKKYGEKSLKEMAKEIGVSVMTIWRYLNNQDIKDETKLEKIKSYFIS